MNGKRIEQAETLEERLAAVAVAVAARRPHRGGFSPDYADFRDAFRPFAELALALAELDGINVDPRGRLKRKGELVRKIAGIDLSGLAAKYDERAEGRAPARGAEDKGK